MDEVLTKISLLRDHLPSPGNGGWKGRRIERDQEGEEEEATEGGGVCISHDESITAVNLTALRSLIPRLHSRGNEGLLVLQRVLMRQGILLQMPHRLTKLGEDTRGALLQLGPSSN